MIFAYRCPKNSPCIFPNFEKTKKVLYEQQTVFSIKYKIN